jgi:WD40 repeat protein
MWRPSRSRRLENSSQQGTSLVFSDSKGQPVSAFEDAEAISALAWSPDGKYLAAGDAGGRVVLFSD